MRALGRARLGTVRVTARVHRDRALADPGPLARLVVAVDVEHDLVAVDVGVVVGHRDRQRVVVDLARDEVADDEVPALEHLVHRWRLVDAPRDRLEVGDVEDVGVEAPVPAHDVERVERQRMHRADDASGSRPAVLDEHLGLVARASAHVLRQQRTRRKPEVALAVGGVLEQLAVLRQVPLRRRDVRVGLDRIRAQGIPRRSSWDPSMRGGPRDDHVVARAHVERSEHRLHPSPTPLHVHALVTDPVAVPGRDQGRHRVRDAHVAVPEDQPASGDGVAPSHRRRVEEVVQAQVARDQRMVRGRRQVADRPLAGVGDRRRDVAVVEQRRVGREALLPHQLLVVERALPSTRRGPPVLGVPLVRDAAHPLVVRHCCSRS